jgi:hypothetical protein
MSIRTERVRGGLPLFVTPVEPVGETLTCTDKRQPTLFEQAKDKIVLTTEKQRAKAFIDGGIHVGCFLGQKKALASLGIEYIPTGIGYVSIKHAPSQHTRAEYNHQREVQQTIVDQSV